MSQQVEVFQGKNVTLELVVHEPKRTLTFDSGRVEYGIETTIEVYATKYDEKKRVYLTEVKEYRRENVYFADELDAEKVENEFGAKLNKTLEELRKALSHIVELSKRVDKVEILEEAEEDC